MPPEPKTADDITILAVVKGDDRYIVIYRQDMKCEALRTLNRWSLNPGLNFGWREAAALSQQIIEG